MFTVSNHAVVLFAPCQHKQPNLKHTRAPVRSKLFDVEAELRLLRLLVVGSHERAVVHGKHALQVSGHLPNAHQAHVTGRASRPPLRAVFWVFVIWGSGCSINSKHVPPMYVSCHCFQTGANRLDQLGTLLDVYPTEFSCAFGIATR